MAENCDVCLYMEADGSTEFYKASKPKARKEHRCIECHKPIPVGTQHEHARGKYDGDFFAVRTCLLCAEIRDVFTCGGGFVHGQLWEEMAQSAFERLTTASPCFRKLSSTAKQRVMDEWREWKGL